MFQLSQHMQSPSERLLGPRTSQSLWRQQRAAIMTPRRGGRSDQYSLTCIFTLSASSNQFEAFLAGENER